MSEKKEDWIVTVLVLTDGGAAIGHEIPVTSQMSLCRDTAFHRFSIDLNVSKQDSDRFEIRRDGRIAGWISPHKIIGVDLVSVHQVSK